MLVVRTAAVTGRAAGLAAVAGIALGCLVWAVASALGVTAVLTASRLAFEVLRAAGVVFLCWLGLRVLWPVRRPMSGGDSTVEAATMGQAATTVEAATTAEAASAVEAQRSIGAAFR